MAANKRVNFGPVALSATLTTNILNPPTLTGGVGGISGNCYFLIDHIRFVNKTGGPVTVSLWLGATGANAAGTEVVGQGLSIAANSYQDWYGALIIDTTQFLVGGASAGTSITMIAEGEVGIR